MSSWSEWIYLGIGLGLGAGGRWLFSKSKLETWQPIAVRQEVSSPVAQENNQNLLALKAKLKQTEIAYQLAHEISQFKGGFLVRTSHELRSPLSSLIGIHQLILSDLCDDPAEERMFVAQAHSSALKLMNLIDEILAVSRLEHGTSQLEIQPLQLATVLTEVYEVSHLIALDRNIQLKVSLPTAELYILADPRWLQQVLLNLLSACLTQMKEGNILISCQTTPAYEQAQILLDVQLPASAWAEPVDLIQSEQLLTESVFKNSAASPGINLLLAQTLLELMQGRLEIVSCLSAVDDPYTRLQLTIPLVIPEVASLEQEEN